MIGSAKLQPTLDLVEYTLCLRFNTFRFLTQDQDILRVGELVSYGVLSRKPDGAPAMTSSAVQPKSQ